jgi:FdhD protein
MSERPHASTPAAVRRVERGKTPKRRSDVLATEEPLEIRLKSRGPSSDQERTLAITMRTPGNDFELVTGFLYGEGLIASKDDFEAVRYCVGPGLSGKSEQLFNTVTVDLTGPMPEIAGLDRHFYTTSACGICGAASLDRVADIGGPVLGDGPRVSEDLLLSLPHRLREGQRVFDKTGGLHAAALFDGNGELEAMREDVGRHNAMDKLAGWGVFEQRLPFTDKIVLVSGRASYELVQKALRAGAGFFCSISAPSSLAVDVASRFGMTLVGFLRDDSFNVYTGEARIV